MPQHLAEGLAKNERKLSVIWEKDLGRLSFICRARDLGFGLQQVRDLLGLSDQKQRSCEAVDIIVRDHLADVDRKFADLKALRRELDSIIRQCSCGTIAEPKRFTSSTKVGPYLGLTPRQYQSGESERIGGIGRTNDPFAATLPL